MKLNFNHYHMTTHEKTRLIELLTSGDEANILMAKEICEQQGLIDCIKKAYEWIKSENHKAHQNLNKRYSKKKDDYVWWFGDKCRWFEIVFSSNVWADVGYIDFLRKHRNIDMNWQIDECMQQYYALHLQNSE